MCLGVTPSLCQLIGISSEYINPLLSLRLAFFLHTLEISTLVEQRLFNFQSSNLYTLYIYIHHRHCCITVQAGWVPVPAPVSHNIWTHLLRFKQARCLCPVQSLTASGHVYQGSSRLGVYIRSGVTISGEVYQCSSKLGVCSCSGLITSRQIYLNVQCQRRPFRKTFKSKTFLSMETYTYISTAPGYYACNLIDNSGCNLRTLDRFVRTEKSFLKDKE